MKSLWLAVALLVSGLLSACSAEEAQETDRQSPPNILFILLDDLGYNDLGLNSSAEGHTPNLDAFAKEGIHFTRHYVDSTCSATRAGFLTGRPPVASGFRPSGLGISPATETLPEILQSLGYSTHHIGKWHLGYASRLAWPTAQGYDSFYGFLNQFLLRGPHPQGRLRIDRPTYRNPWLQEDDGHPSQQQGHLSDLLLKRALDFIEQAPSRSEPWFLNYWSYLPHTPLQPASRFAQQFPATPEGRYRAMLAQLDDAIGQILAALERSGLDKSALVVIASDNGGTNQQINNNAPFTGVKASFTEGGLRTPLIMRWPGSQGAGRTHDEVVSYLDYLPTIVVAAGGKAPAALPGRDLGLLRDGHELESRELYWEAGDSEVNAWGVLSQDGRWRLQRYYHWEPQLYDLHADPAGSRDVSGESPEVVEAMASRFLTWRKRQRRVALEYKPVGERGRAQLTGDPLQRAPGFGGFTFAIGVSPSERAGSEEQVIAAQPGYWRLSQEAGSLRLTMNGVGLKAPAPVAGKCSSVIVTAMFAHRNTDPDSSDAIVDLYIDGELVARADQPRPSLPPDHYLRPTYIGQGAGGGALYAGTLGEPVIYNERIRAQSERDKWVGNGVAALSRQVCSMSEAGNLELSHTTGEKN
jgi:arylsulfatase A-like enzyme